MKTKTLLDIINEEGTIFRDKEVFSIEYIPESYIFRDHQLKKMAVHCRHLKKDNKPQNMKLIGPCASGKTTAVKKFFELLEEHYSNAVCVHVNCQTHTTEYKVFIKIHEKLFGQSMPVGGLSTFSIYSKVMEYVIKENKILIVALDDYDFIKTSKDLNRTLYTLLRAHENYPGAKVSVFTITSNLQKIILDQNVATVFYPIDVEFPSYNLEEMYSILKERCRIGFYKDVITDEIIQEVAQKSYEIGDIRYGLKLLTEIGEKAEKTGSKTIQKEHLK